MNAPRQDDVMPLDQTVLQCQNVTKAFRRQAATVRILDGINLTVRAGEVVAITGRSGAGKSTLLGLMAGLDRPDAGRIVLAGHDLNALTGTAMARLRREKVGIIFQDFNLLPAWTVLENAEAGLLHTGLPRADRRARALALLQSLGLAEHGDRLPAELSIGQQQRVAIARTLVNAPALILADEPSACVDPETAEEIHACLLGSVRKRGVTLIVATHGAFPVALANRVLRLCDGHLEDVHL